MLSCMFFHFFLQCLILRLLSRNLLLLLSLKYFKTLSIKSRKLPEVCDSICYVFENDRVFPGSPFTGIFGLVVMVTKKKKK